MGVRKRVAIAAEASTNPDTVQIPNVPKTDNVLRVLGALPPPHRLSLLPPASQEPGMTLCVRVRAAKAVTGNLLFDILSREARRAIFASMEPMLVSAGTTIISQGDVDASTFYVLEMGNCDVFVSAEGGSPRKVHAYTSERRAPPPSAC